MEKRLVEWWVWMSVICWLLFVYCGCVLIEFNVYVEVCNESFVFFEVG